MTELVKAARQALEFCELCWRDVAMNDYALEKLEQTTAALTQALATTEQGCAHVLYKTADKDKPSAICDRNGEVVLSMCKLCGKAESELQTLTTTERTVDDVLSDIDAATCPECGGLGVSDPGVPDSPDGPGRPAVDCKPCKGTGWRNGVHLPAPKPATTEPYVDSTPHLSVGDSRFESWFGDYDPKHKGTKQLMRDAYAAGMGDPLVTAAPTERKGEPVYQICMADSVSISTAWVDVGKEAYDDAGLYPEYRRRTLYTSPQVPEDTARLDWIERQYLEDLVMCLVIDAPHDGKYSVCGDSGQPGYGKTLREAIDAARKGE